MKSLLLILLTLNFFANGALGADAKPDPAFEKLGDEYIDLYFKLNPSLATAAGLHENDSELEDYSVKGIKNRLTNLKEYKIKFTAVSPATLSPEQMLDRELVIASIDAGILELEEVKSWQRNPDFYSSAVTSSIYSLMSRNFAKPADRLHSIILRETKALGLLNAGKANLKNPPKIFVDIALEQLPGLLDFFRKDVPNAFDEVGDDKLWKEFTFANRNLIQALDRYQTFLKKQILPKAKGDFRLGEKVYLKKLLYEEMVDIPIDKLLEIGEQNLRFNQKRFSDLAKKLEPKLTAAEVLKILAKDHPEPGKLLVTVRGLLTDLRKFIMDHQIVTIPSTVEPNVEETPAFERALTFASMDTPGPFEKNAKEAYFNITLPEASWPKEQVEEHMSGFNRGMLMSTSIHEAYPGHYVQFLWLQKAPTKLRKVFGCNSNAEGWAHYVEQMMLDEGYGKGNLKTQLGQIQDALLRNARYIVGIKMHTGKMTYAEGIQYFINEGYLSPANAERETKRGTSDPTYLVYTLGKLQITKLREDYKKLLGDKFTLQLFHDNFLKQGFPPIKLLRRAMLGNDSPVL